MTPLDHINAQYQAMPPVAAMQVRAVAWDGERLQLHAPLSANVNDKHSAFGGSLAGVMTLAGWGLVTLRLQDSGHSAQVFVADSHVRYLKPLYADLATEARLDAAVDWDHVLRSFREHGRARLAVAARVLGPEGVVVAELTGRFAVLRHD